jgi:hypothetical protein
MKVKQSKCVDCGKKRKHMVFDWVSKQWFCGRCFKTLLSDYRLANPMRHKSTVRKREAL